MAEVMHRHVEEELMVEPPPIWRHDETANLGDGDLTSSSSSSTTSEGTTYAYKIEEVVDKDAPISENNNQGTTYEWFVSGKDINAEDVDMSKLVNAIISSQNDEIVPDAKSGGDDNAMLEGVVTAGGDDDDDDDDDDGEEIEDEEVVELEFERAVEKVHIYTPHCPKCNSHITMVVLRRKIKRRVKRPVQPQPKPVDLFGCFSCFSFFIPSGNGTLNPFRIFGDQKGKKDGKQIAEESQRPVSGDDLHASAEGSTTIKQGTPFDLFSIFKKGKPNQDSSGNDKVPKREEESNINEGESSINNSSGVVPTDEITASNEPLPVGQVAIDIGQYCKTQVFPKNDSRALDIVKCIVYGGLIESITSLGVVSSAAATDVTTLKIIAIGLASVIGSLPIFGQNLMELRSKNSNQETDKYQEELGKRGHFLLHASFAIISFMIFGLLPPVIYGFTFRESDNKDYKILAVAAASFACVFVLAILKAYARSENKMSGYTKTIMYYVTMAVSVSGVSYAAGDLIKLGMERLGLFEPTQPVVNSGMISATSNPAWVSSY